MCRYWCRYVPARRGRGWGWRCLAGGRRPGRPCPCRGWWGSCPPGGRDSGQTASRRVARSDPGPGAARSRPGRWRGAWCPSAAACAPWPTRSAPRTSAASAAAPSHAAPRPGSSWGPGLAPANIFKCYNYFCRHGIILLQFGLKLVLECTLTRLFTTAIKMQRFPSGIILRHFE